MWKPGEEVVFAVDHVLPGELHGYDRLHVGKLYIVKSVHQVPPENCGVGCCESCGSDLGVRVFGVNYERSLANCVNEFRKPLVVEDEITLKVTENV